MDYFRNFSLLVVILCFGASFVTDTDTLKVSLYYESLCPDSVRFVVRQLYPGYQKLGNILNLDFIPYGFATTRTVRKHWSFSCQHGPHECYGNKVQGCSLQQNVTQGVHLNFINCVLRNPDPASEQGSADCASKVGVSWSAIQDCLRSGKGDDLLADYGERTANVRPKIRYIPTIIFNDVFNQTLQDRAEDDFLQTVCDLLTTKPKVCDG